MASTGNIISFIKNSSLFLVGSVLSRMLTFLLLPLYTSTVPTEDFGVYDISLVYVSLVSSVLFFELWSAVLRFLYDFDSPEKKANVVKNGAVIFFGSSIVFIVAALVLFSLLNTRYVALIVGYGIAGALSQYMCFIARGYGKNAQFSVSGVINTGIVLASNLILMLVFKFDYSAMYIGFILGALSQTVYLFFVLDLRSILRRGELDRSLVIDLLRFSLPLCLNTASFWLLTSATKLVYNAVFGYSASGVFSVGSKFGQIIMLATTCFAYAWQDISFSASTRDAPGSFYSGACNTYLQFLASAFALLLPVVFFIFPLFVSSEYASALSLVPSFFAVSLVSGYATFIGNVFYAIKKTRPIMLSATAAGVVAVGLSFPLVKTFGANGANLAVILGFVIAIAIRAFLLRKELGFLIEWKTVVLCTMWVVLSALIFILGNPTSIILSAIVSMLIAGAIFRREIGLLLNIAKQKLFH